MIKYVVSLSTVLFLVGCADQTGIRASGPQISDPRPTHNGVELFGEIHGTNEAPQYFFTQVLKRVFEGERVYVGLEITAPDIASACQSLESPAPANLAARWLGDIHDGRLSTAMANVTCNLTRLPGVTVFPLIADDGYDDRDHMIADAIQRQVANGHAVSALVGNLHNRNAADSAAVRLRAQGLHITTYVFDARRSAEAWMHSSTGERGPRRMSARFCTTPAEAAIGGVMTKVTPQARWDRCISLEQFTPSFPIGRP